MSTEESRIQLVETPIIIPPVDATEVSPEEYAKGKETVLMVFEKPGKYVPQWGTVVKYTKGVHEVPTIDADHWYFASIEARKYDRKFAVSNPGQSKK